MKKLLIMVISTVCLLTLCANIPSVTNVKAQHLHPWEKVAISYEVQGLIKNNTEIYVTAKDNSSGSECLTSIRYLSGDIGTNNGVHRVVWDIGKQGVFINSENTVFSVNYTEGEVYLVVDLSAGENAVSYPISYLYSLPLEGWSDEYKTNKIVFKLIKPGTFMMGGTYNVALTKPYYIGIFEVTQKQYELVMGSCRPSNNIGDLLPVDKAFYNDIRGDSATYDWPTVKTVDSNSFVGRLRAKTGLTFDLPTDAQWEYACRAGTTCTYYWGDSIEGEYAWYNANAGGRTHPVGTRKANAWGLYDMSGNVCEWCLDWRDDRFEAGSDPVGPFDGLGRVLRGGSWNSYSIGCTSSSRASSAPSYSYQLYWEYGFRLACVAEL